MDDVLLALAVEVLCVDGVFMRIIATERFTLLTGQVHIYIHIAKIILMRRE